MVHNSIEPAGCSCGQSGKPFVGWQVFGSVSGFGRQIRVRGIPSPHLTWGQTVTVTCWSAP